MATTQLLTTCLIADGFPKNLDLINVANYFREATGVPAVRLAPLPSGRWVFQVRSNSDRKKCLDNRTSILKWEGFKYTVTLNPPKAEDIPYPDKWVIASEPEVPYSGDPTSLSSDELFGRRNPKRQFVKVETSETTGGSVMEPYSPSRMQSQMSPELNLSGSLQQVQDEPGKAYQHVMYPNLKHLQPQHVPHMFQMTSGSGGIMKSAGGGGYGFRHLEEFLECGGGDQKNAFADISSQGEDLISLDDKYHLDFNVLNTFSDSLSSEPHQQYFLRVTELPFTVNELVLRTYFEDRKNGGGPVLKISLNVSAGEAAIYFEDDHVIQHVINTAPHLLMNKKIKVELVSDSNEQDKAQECRTVEVRSVPDETAKEMCLLYFENPLKGGGDIEDSNWNEEEKVLYITFVDAAVAKQVITRGHTVGGKVLEVTLYTPPPVEEDKGQCTVEVRGFDPQNLELYQLYFENPRRVAGTVTDFQVSEDNDVIYITFQTSEEAEQVAKATHKVGGNELQVTLAPKEDPLTSQPHTIKITKGDLQHVELYSLYFENPKKSGGGIINDIRMDEKEQAVYITFEDPETVSRVCSRSHHVGNHDLEVTLHVPVKTKGQKTVKKTVENQEYQKEPLRTVKVNVGDNIQSEDTYMFYFETKRHGGGDVEKVEIDREKGFVHVTFVKPEVAARIADKKHQISGQPVEVTLYVPPVPRPPYPDKLLFHNVAESTTRDCLAMYLERITGQEPTDLIYADEVGDVLAVFDEDPEFSKVQEMCRQKKLEGRQISVSRVPISNCILVENLSKKTTEDTLLFYFEGKRSGGGQVEKVTIDHENGRCLVFFENSEVIENILEKSHTLDESKLKVTQYMECLGPSGGSKDATTFTLPKPVEFKDVDKYKVAFIRQSATLQGLNQKLKDLHASPRFSDNMLSVECTLTTSVQQVRVLARTWTNDVQEAVDSIYSMIVVLRQVVMQEIWDETEKSVTTIKPSSRDSAVIFTLSEEKAFIVVGMKSMADDLMKQVKQIVIQKEEEAERKTQEITETNRNLKPFQLRLLSAMSFQSEVAKRHAGLKVDIRTTKGEISYHGMIRDVKEAQVEMYERLQLVKFDKLTTMTNMQKSLLGNKETRDYVLQKFKAEKIVAVWDVDSQGEITVYSFSDKYLVNAIHIMQKSVVQHQRPLEPETADLLMSSEWNQFVVKITGDYTGVLKIVPLHNGHQLFIAGTDNIMHAVVEETERFLKENTIYMLSCHFFPSLQFFVTNYWLAKVISIGNNLRAYKVEVSLDESGQDFNICGTQTGLDLMKKNLQQLGSEVICHLETLTEKAKVKFLLSPNCERDLDKLGQSVQCVFSLRKEPFSLMTKESRSTQRVSEDPPSEERRPAITVQWPGGAIIMVVQGDITQLPVEVIVNAANTRLDHAGGLAKHIVDKGGKAIQDECNRHMTARGAELREGDTFRSGPGTLSCKAIIHAVGPMYRGGRSGEENCLHDLVVKCLDSTSAAGFNSIAIPALSAGIFGYPPDEATRVITEGVRNYVNTYRKSNLQQVYLCGFTPDIVEHFVRATQKVFPSAATTKQKPKPFLKSRNAGQSRTALNTGLHSAGQRVIRISVIEGEIAQQNTDVIVNSTSKGLDLRNGAVSSSLLKGAGPGLQDECKQKYPKGIESTEIAFTTSHNLNCKAMLHLALCNYSNANAEQILSQMVRKCLKEVSKHDYTSIAFPPLGTGQLGYPLDVVADTMIGAIEQFEKDTHSFSVREVKIVIYNSPDTVKAFRSRVGTFQAGGRQQCSPNEATGSRENRVFSEEPFSQPSSPASSTSPPPNINAEFDLGGLRLIVKQGDITEEKVDAIINSTNTSLDLSRGAVASALRQKCGYEFEAECKEEAAEMKKTGIVCTRIKHQPFKAVLHIDANRFVDDLKTGIQHILKTADSLGMASISIPALGTGAGSLTPSESARHLMKALCDFCNGKRQNLNEVRMVMFEKSMIPQTIQVIQEVGEKLSKSKAGLFGIVKALAGFGGPSLIQTYKNPVVEQAKLFVYGDSAESIRKAIRQFDDLVKDKFMCKEIVDDMILNMTEDELQKIKSAGQSRNVEVKIQPFAGRVIIDGMHADVFDAGNEINKIIREADRYRQQAQQASMLANMVQWCFLEVTQAGTEQKEYKERENQIIESAYQQKKKIATIRDSKGLQYVIDFNSMKEYPKLDPDDTVAVIRKDKMKESSSGVLPENWTIQPDKEILKLVNLIPQSSEYQDVEKNFRSTLAAVTVVSIERIENPTQYRQYMAKKVHLEKQNAGIQNEQTLWHGTASDVLSNINHYGFNRSYCGKNATVYGQGVYFAVNSQYSAQPTYSPPDPSTGHRYVYQCKVLVGHPVAGNNTMRFLPARSGHIQYDSSTDNPQNPSLYAIFNDTQAYPEYLITFR